MDPSSIQGELVALQKQRRQNELKLRDIDRQRRGPPPGALPPRGTGRDGPPLQAAWGAERSEGGPPKEGKWKHDGVLPRTTPVGARSGGRLGDVPEQPRVRSVVSSVVSVVSRPGADEDDGEAAGRDSGLKRGALDDDELPSRRKRRVDDRDDDEGAGDERRPQKSFRTGDGHNDQVADPNRRDMRRSGGAWRELSDSSRMPRMQMQRRMGTVHAVGDGDGSTGAVPKVAGGPMAEADKKRSRRMFGNLLGHLQKAKKHEEVLNASDKMQARAELDAKAEELAANSSQLLREQQKRERIEARKQALANIREIKLKTTSIVHNLTMARADLQHKHLVSGGYILTTAEPPIFWRPKRFDGSLEKKSKRTVDELGGKLIMLKKKLEAEREEDISAEMARQREIEERFAAAKEMAEARAKALAEDEGAQGGAGEDDEAAAVEKEIQDEEDGDEEVEEEEEEPILEA